MKIDAYLSNLGKYTSGWDAGDWIRLPITQQDFQQVCRRIGLDGIHYEEYFFPEYETDVPGLYDALPEFADISTLNYCAACVRKLDEPSLNKLEAVLSVSGYVSEPADIITLTRNLDAFDVYSDVKNEEELGRYCINELKLLRINEEISWYFNYELYGETYAINTGGYFTEHGFFCENRTPIKQWDGIIPAEYIVSLPSPQPVKCRKNRSR